MNNIRNIDHEDCYKVMVTRKGTPKTTLRYNNEDLVFASNQSLQGGEVVCNTDFNIYFNGELGQRKIATQLFNRSIK